MFVLEEAAHYVKFFCFKKLGQVTIHFRLNKIRLQDVWWKSDTTVNIVVREALTSYRKPHTISFWSNSQLALEFNRELLWFCFSSFYDWSKKITPLYQPIKFKTKPSRVLIDRVFPRCWLLTYFYFDFSLTPQPIKFKTKTSRVLVDRVFPRCRKLTYFYSDFSLTPQPIKLKTKTNRVFVERVFPRFAQLTCVYFDFSLVPQPIKFKTKTSRVLVDHVFPRFRQLTYFYFDFSLALSDVSLL